MCLAWSLEKLEEEIWVYWLLLHANKDNQHITTYTSCTDIQGANPPSTGLSVTLAFQVSGKFLFWPTLTQNYMGKGILGNVVPA